jgi:hypothetical protein
VPTANASDPALRYEGPLTRRLQPFGRSIYVARRRQVLIRSTLTRRAHHRCPLTPVGCARRLSRASICFALRRAVAAPWPARTASSVVEPARLDCPWAARPLNVSATRALVSARWEGLHMATPRGVETILQCRDWQAGFSGGCRQSACCGVGRGPLGRGRRIERGRSRRAKRTTRQHGVGTWTREPCTHRRIGNRRPTRWKDGAEPPKHRRHPSLPAGKVHRRQTRGGAPGCRGGDRHRPGRATTAGRCGMQTIGMWSLCRPITRTARQSEVLAGRLPVAGTVSGTTSRWVCSPELDRSPGFVS